MEEGQTYCNATRKLMASAVSAASLVPDLFVCYIRGFGSITEPLPPMAQLNPPQIAAILQR